MISESSQASARDPGTVAVETLGQDLDAELTWLPVYNHNWEIDAVFETWQKGQFRRDLPDSSFSVNEHNEIWFHIPSTMALQGKWLVHSEQPGIKSFILYYRGSDGTWQSDITGDGIPWNRRPVSYGRHTLPLPIGQDILFLRIVSDSKILTNVEILEPEKLLVQTRVQNLILVFTYAWILLIAIALLFARVILKMKYILWLSFASFCYAAALFVFEGSAAEFLWPGSAWPTLRLIYLFGMLATGAHLSFVCARVLNRGDPKTGGWVGPESIAFAVCLTMFVVMPIGWAGLFWVIVTGINSVTMALLVRNYDVDAGEVRVVDTSNLVMLIATFMLVSEFSGMSRIGAEVYVAIWGLIGLVPTIWFLGVGRYYQNLEVEHEEAHRTSLGFQNELNEAFESRLQIFSSIAHHLNNPLNYIQLAVAAARGELSDVQRKIKTLFEHADKTAEAQKIQRQFEESFDRCESVFDDASFGVQRAARVVDEMRGLSSIDGEAAQLMPLKDILESMKRRAADDLGQKIIEPVNLRENLDEIESYNVYGNPYLIIHAMKNIVNNGFLFARRSSQPVPELVIDVDAKCQEGFVRILVSNNGPVISTEHEPNIFRMGFSSYGRRGTGLNVTQSIVRESGGSVSLEDNGRDSGWVKFSIVLPMLSDVERSPTLSK